ncbi:hypothetical protein EV424DRAFT_1343134 [Suillus variegatus]|nr:hypothetical protein EV424DRAFT_1343134 [Suillus variegatus]
MAEYEVISQFSEDAYAKEKHICDCPVCRAKIRKVTINPPPLVAMPCHTAGPNILIKISAVCEGGDHKKCGVPIENICEGKRGLNAQIHASGLIELALVTIVSKLQIFSGEFVWQVDEFIVQDSGWVDLSSCRCSVPYSYDQCQQLSRKGSKTIVSKLKQFTLMIVLPEM